MTFYNNNNSTFTVHDEKLEISSDHHQDINQEARLHYNTLDHRNTTKLNNITHPYFIGNDTIQRLNRIQQYNKAYNHCLKQKSGLEVLKNKKIRPLPPAPQTSSLSTMPRNSTDTINPLKRILHDNNNKLSSFIKRKHIVDVKKKLSHRQSFMFSTTATTTAVKNRPKRYSDVLTDKVLVA